MKVDETKPVAPSPTIRRKVQPSLDSAESFAHSHHQTEGEDKPSEEDDAIDIESFHGLAPEEMTDNVRLAMMQLIEEIAQLRQELNRNRKRIAYLSNLADHDELSTVLNRRAFLRELTHAQILAREFGALNTLLFMTVRNLKEINETHGHAVGDAVVEHVAQTVLCHIGKADVMGRLGGAEFASVLVGYGVEDSHEKAAWIEKLLSNQPYIDGELRIPLEVDIAVHPLEAEEEAESAVLSDDRDHTA